MSYRAKNVTGIVPLILMALVCLKPCEGQSTATNCTQTPAEARPEITSELKQDTQTITGRVAPLTAAASHTCSARVELWLRQNGDDSRKATDDDLKQSTDDQGNQLRILLATQTVAGTQFTINLPKPLKANQSLFLNEIITDTPNSGTATDESNKFSDGAFKVAALSNCMPSSPDTRPQVSSNVVEGTKEVKGSIGQMIPAANHVCGARVELWLRLVAPSANAIPSQTESVDSNGSQVSTLLGSATASGNQFDITLSDPLLAGQTLFLKEIPTDTASSGSDNGKAKDLDAIVSDKYIKVDTFGSWGLVRAYFTSGFLLSQDQGSFSQSNLFMSFTLDKTWKMPGYYFGRKGKTGAQAKQLRWPPGINSFFETRLTAIPVNSCSLPSSGTSTSSDSSTGTNCTNTQSSGSGSNSNNLDTFLANRKTARLDVGAYIPFIMTGWTYKGSPNSLFLAPIGKIGFDTPAGSLSQAQPSTTNNGNASTPGTVTAVNPTNFYKFYTFGGRFGHYAMTSSRDEAPETLSYLDFTFGRFSNLESLVNTKTLADSRMRLWRINVEGILKIPSTPLIIGFSANVGMSNPGAPKLVRGAGDDLRFLFGAKFDVAKLLAHISQVAP